MHQKEIKVDYLIIGGGIAGTIAAETIRKNDSKGTITIVSDEPYNFYSRILLSKPGVFLGKTSFDALTLRKDEWYAQNKITLIAGKKAAELDIKSKTIILEDSSRIQYSKLLLTVGMVANKLSIEGADKQGVFYVRNQDDARAIAGWIPNSGPKAVVIGGGFIGLEMCEILQQAGKEVIILIREKYYWQPLLDEISGRLIEEALEKNGIKVMLETESREIVGDGKVEQVVLTDRIRLDCETVVIGVGASVPLDLASKAGLKVNRGIVTDEFLQASDSNVWAAGDAAEYKDVILDENVQMGNWANAQEQGRTAGANMSGKAAAFKFVSFYNTSAFGLAIAFVGDIRAGEGKTFISRGNGADGTYARLVTKGGELIGATLINRTAEMATLRQLIERDMKVGDKEAQLADPKFDLKKLFT